MADDIWPDHPTDPSYVPPGGAAPGTGQWPDHPTDPSYVGTFQPGQANLLPNAPYGNMDMFAHGLSFGLTDPIRAAKEAALDWVFPGRPDYNTTSPGAAQPARGFDFNRRWNEIARGREQFQQEHPVLSTVENLGGSLLYGPVRSGLEAAQQALPLRAWPWAPGAARTAGYEAAPEITTAAAPSVGRQMLTGGGIGAGGGAVAGASDNPNDPLGGATTGAGYGFLFGTAAPAAARAVGAVGSGLGNYLWPDYNAQRNAIDKLRDLTSRDIRAGQPDLDAADRQLNESSAPLSMFDMYPSVRRWVGSLYHSWADPSTTIFNTLNAKDLAARDRIMNQIDMRTTAGPSTLDAQDALHTQQQTAAGPAYDAFRAAPPVNPDHMQPGGELASILNTPVAKQGMREALEITGNRRIDPTTLGYTFDADGNVQYQSVPSWRTLDWVKQGIDAHINKQFPRSPITGERDFGTAGSAILDARSALLDYMDRNNPHYAAARDAYSGPQGSLDALDLGAKDLFGSKISPAQQQRNFAALSPADQEWYRLGATNALRDRIGGALDAQDESKLIANSPAMRQKLAPLFPDRDNYDGFLAHLNDERSIFQNRVDVLGNSATAARVGAMAANASASPSALAMPAAALAAVHGGPVAGALTYGAAVGAHKAGGWWQRATQLAAGNSPEMQHTAVGMALAPGQAGRQVIGLLQQPEERQLGPGYVRGSVAGAQAPQNTLPFIYGLLGGGNSDNSPSP
jgi:hypothetical protein